MICENDVINTILAEKGLLCEEKKMEPGCSIDHVKPDFIKVADLYALPGNAVNNPYAGPALPAGALPSATKADRGNHGFGLRSIRYPAIKYNGWLELSTADSMFPLQIMLPKREDAAG